MVQHKIVFPECFSKYGLIKLQPSTKEIECAVLDQYVLTFWKKINIYFVCATIEHVFVSLRQIWHIECQITNEKECQITCWFICTIFLFDWLLYFLFFQFLFCIFWIEYIINPSAWRLKKHSKHARRSMQNRNKTSERQP